MSSNIFEMKIVGNNNNLIIPISDDVIELNRHLLESNLASTDNNAMDQIPYYAGAVNYTKSNNPMPVLDHESLDKPITISLPDDTQINGPFILLNKALEDGSRCTGTRPPENTITPDFLSHTQNVIQLSNENGLPNIPVLSDPNNKLNTTGIVNSNYTIKQLDNTDFTPSMTTSHQLASLSVPRMNVPQMASHEMDEPEIIVEINEPKLISNYMASRQMNAPHNMASHQMNAPHNMDTPRVVTHHQNKMINTLIKNRNLIKKVLMWLSIALVIYIIYLILSKRR